MGRQRVGLLTSLTFHTRTKKFCHEPCVNTGVVEGRVTVKTRRPRLVGRISSWEPRQTTTPLSADESPLFPSPEVREETPVLRVGPSTPKLTFPYTGRPRLKLVYRNQKLFTWNRVGDTLHKWIPKMGTKSSLLHWCRPDGEWLP